MKTPSKKAILDLEGATCTSCVYTIEHVGSRIKGVEDIYVDRGAQQINLEYNGDTAIVEKLIGIIQRIGYNASLRTAEE